MNSSSKIGRHDFLVYLYYRTTMCELHKLKPAYCLGKWRVEFDNVCEHVDALQLITDKNESN